AGGRGAPLGPGLGSAPAPPACLRRSASATGWAWRHRRPAAPSLGREGERNRRVAPTHRHRRLRHRDRADGRARGCWLGEYRRGSDRAHAAAIVTHRLERCRMRERALALAALVGIAAGALLHATGL